MDTYLILLLLAFPLLAGALALWAADLKLRRKDSALAKIVGMASRAAGRINETLMSLPVGSSRDLVRNAAIAAAVKEIRAEMAPQIARVGGTDEKVAGIVLGELGKLAPGAVPSPEASAALLNGLADVLLSRMAAREAAPAEAVPAA